MAQPQTVKLGDPHYTLTIQVSRTEPARVVYKDEYDKQGTRVDRQVEKIGELTVRGTDLADVLSRGESLIPALGPADGTD